MTVDPEAFRPDVLPAREVRWNPIRRIAVLGLLALIACTRSEGTSPAPEGRSNAFAFEHVDVIPMDGERLLRDRTVLVEEGLIVAVDPADRANVPPSARRIDGRGKYLLPGLADLHVHPLSEDELLEYLRHGVTTVLIMRGRPRFLAWRDRIEDGDLAGPTLYSVGPTTDGFPPLGWKFVGVTSPDAARCVVSDQEARGYDAIKVYNRYVSETFAAVNSAADSTGLPVVGHVPRALGSVRALELGQDMIAHGEEFYFADFRLEDDRPDRSLLPEIVNATRASGAYVTPMLSSTPEIVRFVEDPEGLLAEPRMRFAAPATYHAYKPENNGYASRPEPDAFVARNRIMYAFLRELTRALHEAGVPLLAGTDAGVVGLPGDQLHRELEELVSAGLSPYEALRTATVEAGLFATEHLGSPETFGTVTAGARADLLLLEANPLEDVARVRRIAGVMARGRWFPADTLARDALAVADSYRDQRSVVDRFDRLAAEGRLEEAVALAREAQQEYGDDPLFHESVVRRHALVAFDEHPRGAIEMLRLDAELYPDFHAVHTTLGQAYLEVGDTTAAVGAFEHALELSACDGVAATALEEIGSRASQ